MPEELSKKDLLQSMHTARLMWAHRELANIQLLGTPETFPEENRLRIFVLRADIEKIIQKTIQLQVDSERPDIDDVITHLG
jgi:hypothetical protein